jgi:hypothetical protein
VGHLIYKGTSFHAKQLERIPVSGENGGLRGCSLGQFRRRTLLEMRERAGHSNRISRKSAVYIERPFDALSVSVIEWRRKKLVIYVQ